MNQTWALLIDAYRDLQARKLFWITLVLSLMVAVAFAFVGINERGITVFGGEFPTVYNTSIIPVGAFYKFLFLTLAIPTWLGLFASILSLISVGGVFPDLMGGGAIDLYLCRPISRVRLFLTKYLFALLFTALQVLVFSTASFFVIGVRGGTWEFGIFLAVPLVTLFFSYLYCVCTLLGVLTRSTLAAILLTLLFWAGLWALNSTDVALTMFTVSAEREVARQRVDFTRNDEILRKNAALPENERRDFSRLQQLRDKQHEELLQTEDAAGKLRWWQKLLFAVKTPLPKTAETVDLMSRWLVEPDPFQKAQEESFRQDQERRARRGGAATRPREGIHDSIEKPETQKALADEIGARKAVGIIGSSLGFEAVVLALAAWIFCRRDY